MCACTYIQRIVLPDGQIRFPSPAGRSLVQVQSFAQLQILVVVDVFIRDSTDGYAHRHRSVEPHESKNSESMSGATLHHNDDGNSQARSDRRQQTTAHNPRTEKIHKSDARQSRTKRGSVPEWKSRVRTVHPWTMSVSNKAESWTEHGGKQKHKRTRRE